ncbi:MAG: DUF2188 domain-containing protein [Clostridiales bacterium]|nr:DUF2188 domain-containing protein [Clostridiales bacterium]
MFLLSNAFLNFLQEYLTYIVIGVSALVLIVIAIIIAIAVKRSKKPLTYVSDEIDRTVDQAAKQKATLSAQATSNDQAEKASTQSVALSTKKNDEACQQDDGAKPDQAQEKAECESLPNEVEPKEQPLEQAITEIESPSDEEPTAAQAASAQTEPIAEQAAPEQPEPIAEQAAPQQTEPSTEQTQKADDQKEQPESTTDALEQADENQQDGDEILPQKSRPVSYRVVYDSETRTWEVRKDNAKRVIRRVHTKKEALQIAQELSQNQELNLVVHKKDGKFQKRR